MGRRDNFKQTEVGMIPVDWDVKSLGEIAAFSNGKAHEQFIDDMGDYIVVNSKFISTQGTVSKNSNKCISPLKKGEITMVMSDVPNGKALARCFTIPKDNKYTLNQRICSVSSKSADNDFLALILNRNKYYLSFDSGTGQTNLRRQDVLECPLQLPPTKTEQTAIANALSAADALIQTLTLLIAKKRQIKQGAMQTLLNPYENGRLKAGWVEKKLGDIATFKKGKGLPKSQITPSGKFECIHYGELFTNYKEHISHILSRTDFEGDTYVSKSNDILMPTSDVTPNGLATASCIVQNGVILGGDILVIRPNENTLDGVFFSYLINIEREQVMQLVTGSTVYHLYGSDMAKFEFSMPEDTGEQTRIATIISDMDADIAALEAKLTKTQQIKQGMMQNLLTGRIRLVKTEEKIKESA